VRLRVRQRPAKLLPPTDSFCGENEQQQKEEAARSSLFQLLEAAKLCVVAQCTIENFICKKKIYHCCGISFYFFFSLSRKVI